MTIRVQQTTDAADVLARARGFLATRPVEHNLVLTILHDRVAHPEPGRYWLVTNGDAVVGVALQSPTSFFATLTPMPSPAVTTLAEAIADTVPDLPGINGEAGTAAAFAGHWAEIRRTPAAPDIGMRLYRLGELRVPNAPSGRARVATGADHELSVAWTHAFAADIGEPPLSDPDPHMKAAIAAAHLWVWDDAGPRSMVGFRRTVSGIARIGPVYTPPEHRRQGYAAACTAAVSQHILDHHANGCVLYTALANPTSNAIYRSIGFEAVCEVLRYRFGN